MSYKSLLLIAFFSLVSTAFSLEKRSNFEILDSLARRVCSEIAERLNGETSATFRVEPFEGDWLIKNALKRVADEKGLRLRESDEEGAELKIYVSQISVSYEQARSNADSLIRKIRLAADFRVGEKLFSASGDFEDEISRRDVRFLERPSYPFAKGKIPPRKKSVLTKIAEPLIFVGSAILVVVLLFTIRSG